MQSTKSFLLVSSSATPNGRLHLGHIGGPFLQLDVFARHQRQAGHRVMFCSAIDAYDSYVHFLALKSEQSPLEVISHFYQLIKQDLTALDISLDHFVNITEPPYAEWYQAAAAALDSAIAQHTGWQQEIECIAYRQSDDLPLIGRWIGGQCPVCQAETYGELCEGCGTLLCAQDLINPITECDQHIIWRQQQNHFMKTDTASLAEHVANQYLPPRVQSIASRFLLAQSYAVRWTSYANWGLPYHNNTKQVFCHRGLLAAEQVMFGQCFATGC